MDERNYYDVAYICNDYNMSSVNASIDSIIEAFRGKSGINFHIIDLNISQEKKHKLSLKLNKHCDKNPAMYDMGEQEAFYIHHFFGVGGGGGL